MATSTREIDVRVLTDKFRTRALMLLSAALAAQVVWTVFQLSRSSVGSLWRPIWFTLAFLLVAFMRGQVPVINLVGRLTIGFAFLLALWNRFEDFAGFVRYTGLVLSFMPAAVVPSLAVIATVCELTLCVAMLLGIKTRWASLGSGVLLFSFATAMTISHLSQFDWAVYVLATGGLLLATVDATLLSVDSLTRAGK